LIYAERVLEADPKDFRATLMLANYYATRTRENDLDREEKLAKAEKYANQVIEMVKTAPKPNPQITDEQWTDAKKDTTAEAYNNIGLANLTRKKYDAAAAGFKSAVEANSRPEPAYMVRLASALQSAGKNDEAIVWCDKSRGHPRRAPADQERGIADTCGGHQQLFVDARLVVEPFGIPGRHELDQVMEPLVCFREQDEMIRRLTRIAVFRPPIPRRHVKLRSRESASRRVAGRDRGKSRTRTGSRAR